MIILTQEIVRSFLCKRDPESHKGNYGHALLMAGSKGKMGACLLATEGCLRTGVGLLTVHIPQCGYEIVQSSIPEAMVSIDPAEEFISICPSEINKYKSIGIGPGIGTSSETKSALVDLLKTYLRPVVIDADAINILAEDHTLWSSIPQNSILTPHPGEFKRLVGAWENKEDQLERLKDTSRRMNAIIVLKGHQTLICTPEGKVYENTTGNPGMAKGGSGDVLTGMITSFLSQGYNSEESAILAVYIHGLAGDLAAQKLTEYAMLPSDLIKEIPSAFRMLI